MKYILYIRDFREIIISVSCMDLRIYQYFRTCLLGRCCANVIWPILGIVRMCTWQINNNLFQSLHFKRSTYIVKILSIFQNTRVLLLIVYSSICIVHLIRDYICITVYISFCRAWWFLSGLQDVGTICFPSNICNNTTMI